MDGQTNKGRMEQMEEVRKDSRRYGWSDGTEGGREGTEEGRKERKEWKEEIKKD